MNQTHRLILIGSLLLLASTQSLHAQMSVDDAQKLMRDRRSTRPATTQPMSELDKLREQNTQLREENMALRQEVASLREALDHLMRFQASAAPTTRPAATQGVATAQPVAPAPAASGLNIVGHYRGGSNDDGTAFLVQFKADGTYEQNWLMPPRTEPGHYQLDSDGTLEMWSDRAAPAAPHHLWRITSDDNQITLTPLLPNGEASADPPQVLTKAAK